MWNPEPVVTHQPEVHSPLSLPERWERSPAGLQLTGSRNTMTLTLHTDTVFQ